MTAQTEHKQTVRSSIIRYLGATGFALWALVVTLEPDVGFIAPLPWMAFFWAMQISIGLAVLQLVLFLSTRLERFRRWPLWVVVITSGVIGSILLSPIYSLIGEGLMEQVLGFKARLDSNDDIDASLAFGLPAVLGEFSNIVGPVTASWVLISWPRLQRLVPPLVNTGGINATESDAPSLLLTEQVAAAKTPAWRTALPSALGDELIAIGSELQYLRVWTSRGTALVLGSLQEVEETEGPAGIRVHRSWWVNIRYVTHVRAKGDGVVCELSNGLEVPVSRRRKADVITRYGTHARYRTESILSTPALTQSDQNIRRKPI